MREKDNKTTLTFNQRMACQSATVVGSLHYSRLDQQFQICSTKYYESSRFVCVSSRLVGGIGTGSGNALIEGRNRQALVNTSLSAAGAKASAATEASTARTP